jgi:hypothetical protein
VAEAVPVVERILHSMQKRQEDVLMMRLDTLELAAGNWTELLLSMSQENKLRERVSGRNQ